MTRTDHHPICLGLQPGFSYFCTKGKWLYQLSIPSVPDCRSSYRNEFHPVSGKNQLLFGRALLASLMTSKSYLVKQKHHQKRHCIYLLLMKLQFIRNLQLLPRKWSLKTPENWESSKIFIHQPDNYIRRSYCHYTRNEMRSLKQPTKRLWVLLQQNGCH